MHLTLTTKTPPPTHPPNQVAIWHKIGRLRRSKFPNPKGLGRDIAFFGLTAGRLMADTYLTAREHLRETTYSLTHLASSQLRLPHPRVQIDPMQVRRKGCWGWWDVVECGGMWWMVPTHTSHSINHPPNTPTNQVPSFFGSAKLIVNLAQHTAFDAQLVQRLALRLQVTMIDDRSTWRLGLIGTHTGPQPHSLTTSSPTPTHTAAPPDEAADQHLGQPVGAHHQGQPRGAHRVPPPPRVPQPQGR